MQFSILKDFEWLTISIIFCCYSIWLFLIAYGDTLPLVVWIIALALTTTFYLSIMHETVHGHPTPNPKLNHLFVIIPIGWVFPFERFRDTHLAHHDTSELTDPLDDPESWYVFANDWSRTGLFMKLLLTFNNTLFGRMLIGPAISLSRFFFNEVTLIITRSDLRMYLLRVWGMHGLLCLLLASFITSYGTHSFWAYLIATYLGLSILLIRTFLEHQAAENQKERTVIIEKNCPIAFLFLFNNLHALHHEKPGIPWYRLPQTYHREKDRLKALNNHYVYSSYVEIFKLFFLTPKEPVMHPLAPFKVIPKDPN